EANYNGTDQDLTTLDLHAFHFEMAGNPMDVNLHLATPMSDMRVQGMAKGLIDFASLADVVPLEELKLSGKLETDIIINTLMSCIENEDYENVDVRGNLVISDLLFHTPALPDSLDLKQLSMRFTPEFVYLDGMDAVIGLSDLHLEGHLTNFIPYIFKGETVSGTLNVASDLLDLNPFVPEKDTAAFSESDSLGVSVHDTAETEQALRIPQNIDFGMRLEMKKILYQQIMVENLNGKIHVNEGIAILEGLGLDILDGKVSTEGKVDTRKELTYVTAGLDIRGVDIPRSYETLVTVEKLAPMAKYCKGRFNTDMTYESFLDNSFEPVYESINAQGNLSTEDLQVYNLKSFIRLSEVLKNEKLKNIVPDDVSLAFRIEDGRVMVEPFDVRFENSRMNVSGSHGIDRTMDYYLDMEIARSDLGTGAGELLSRIGALASAAGLQIPESDYVKVMAHIGGTFEDPVVTTDLSGNVRSKGAEVEEQFRERVEQEIGEKEEEIRDQAGEEAERIIREAEAEAARIIEQAEKAGAEIVAEAERQGDKLIREAGSNPIKKAAAERAARELKKQAEEKSAALILEAEKRADAVIAGAKEEASKIRN
ncbi:MAG: hypothetical protein JXA39_08010, partial [Bacteroidales bacterium]|nr:hypothetical protein [Bacteroidales bacterium]